jgi:hypothetical protein
MRLLTTVCSGTDPSANIPLVTVRQTRFEAQLSLVECIILVSSERLGRCFSLQGAGDLSVSSASRMHDVRRRLLESNPVLEAFGNAQTIRYAQKNSESYGLSG